MQQKLIYLGGLLDGEHKHGAKYLKQQQKLLTQITTLQITRNGAKLIPGQSIRLFSHGDWRYEETPETTKKPHCRGRFKDPLHPRYR